MASGSAPATPLLYSAIAYKDTILTEHTTAAASAAASLAHLVLGKITHSTPQKLTYEHDENFVHYIADAAPSSRQADKLSAAGLTYIVVAKKDLGKRVPFGYLVEIKKRFLKDYDPERTGFATLPAYRRCLQRPAQAAHGAVWYNPCGPGGCICQRAGRAR